MATARHDRHGGYLRDAEAVPAKNNMCTSANPNRCWPRWSSKRSLSRDLSTGETRQRGLPFAVVGLWLFVILWGPTPSANACSTFCLASPQQTVFGKNYDWYFADAHLIVNKRQMERRSKVSPLTWTSTHGSVTFNQFGRNSPSGGINEAGVVVELMWHDSARYSADDDRLAIGNLEWIQYQLDTASTVDEIIASDAKIRILHSDEPLHYLVADAQGGVASIEFLRGRMVVHQGETMPVKALTNDDYSRCLDFWQRQDRQRQVDGPAASQMSPREAVAAPHLSGHGSLQRFARAAHWLHPQTPPEDAVVYAFEALADLAQGPSTRWSIVYELEDRRLHFKIRRQPAVYRLSLDDLDFACQRPVQSLDLLTAQPGDLAPQLSDYSIATNRRILTAAFRQIPERQDTPEEEMAWRSQHPSGDRCLVAAPH